MTGPNRVYNKDGTSYCLLCAHEPNKYHSWQNDRCVVCGKWKLGTIERRTEDFWAKVEKSDGCWEWIGHRLQTNGYGQTAWNGKREVAHRISWMLSNAPVPKGMVEVVVMHRCDNRACVRPDHLMLGTQKQNIADMFQKRQRARAKGAAVS